MPKLRILIISIYSPQLQNLGEKVDLSAGWTKNALKKRSIDGYVSIFQRIFYSIYAKYSFVE
jgi:hypothetical protein